MLDESNVASLNNMKAERVRKQNAKDEEVSVSGKRREEDIFR